VSGDRRKEVVSLEREQPRGDSLSADELHDDRRRDRAECDAAHRQAPHEPELRRRSRVSASWSLRLPRAGERERPEKRQREEEALAPEAITERRRKRGDTALSRILARSL
jgi:hypothetical protein